MLHLLEGEELPELFEENELGGCEPSEEEELTSCELPPKTRACRFVGEVGVCGVLLLAVVSLAGERRSPIRARDNGALE